MSLNNLALLYDNQGKYSEAEPLYKRALHIWEQSLGSQHPNTQQVRQNYADLLRAMGCDDEAQQIEQEEYENAGVALLQQLIHNFSDDAEHDDENEVLFLRLQELLGGRDAALALLQDMLDNAEAEQIAPNDDETEAAEPTMPDDEHDDAEAQQLEDPQ
jgi:tetratricopeptide (TPR) repeat protein